VQTAADEVNMKEPMALDLEHQSAGKLKAMA